jgi:glutaredoxin 3
METTVTGPQVTIYTGDDCHWCAKAKQYLAQRGIAYIERNVETDAEAAADAIRLSGHRGVPVIVVGEQVIEGFRRRELDAALHLEAADAATEARLPPAQEAIAAALAAARLAWTPDQEATAARLVRLLDGPALCAYLGRQLDYSPANCDHTFRHVAAFLAAQPPAETDPATLFTLLQTLDIRCDCGVASNICAR